MSGAAVVDPAVIADVARALARYGAAEESVFSQVDAAVRATSDRVLREHARRRQELAAAQAALEACRQHEGADCSVLALAVREAQTRLDLANQAMRQITAAVARYQPAKARHAATVQGLLLGARTHLGRKAGEIESYLAAGASSGGGGPMGSGAGGGGGNSAVRDTAVKMAKALAWDLGPTLVSEGLQLAGVDVPLGVDDLVGNALATVREPGALRAGVTMTAEAGYAHLGAALTQVRSWIDG